MVEDFFSMYESNGFHFYSAFYSIEWRHMAATPKVKWPETMTQLLCFPKRKGKCFGEQLYRLASYTVQFYAHIDCPQTKSARIKYQCIQTQQTVHAYYMYISFGKKLE